MLSSFARMASYQMRRKDRQIVSKSELFSIVNTCKFASVGLIDKSDPSNIKPYVVPLSYGIKWDKGSDNPLFYFHSAKNGRKIKLLNGSTQACVTLVKSANINPFEIKGPNPDVCSASIMHYESVIIEGQIEKITNESEKQEALSLILDHYGQPKGPMNLNTLSQTCVFKLTAESMSGKKNF